MQSISKRNETQEQVLVTCPGIQNDTTNKIEKYELCSENLEDLKLIYPKLTTSMEKLEMCNSWNKTGRAVYTSSSSSSSSSSSGSGSGGSGGSSSSLCSEEIVIMWEWKSCTYVQLHLCEQPMVLVIDKVTKLRGAIRCQAYRSYLGHWAAWTTENCSHISAQKHSHQGHNKCHTLQLLIYWTHFLNYSRTVCKLDPMTYIFSLRQILMIVL